MDFNSIIAYLIEYGSVLALVLFLLTFTTNIIVEVFKSMIPKLPTNFLVFIVAIVVTILALFIAAAILEITVMWYYTVGAVVLGVFVAYAAMFGFDKFKELFERLQSFKT